MSTSKNERIIDKNALPFTSLSKQAASGLYWEYTFFTAATPDDDSASIHVKNVAMFAAGAYLLTKRSTGRVRITPTGGRVTITDGQSNFRSKLGGTETFDPTETFGTVIHAWEYATRRPTVASADFVAGDGGTESYAVGVHAVLSEPLFVPISEADNAEIANGNMNTVRRIARTGENIWNGLSPFEAWADGNPAHRLPTTSVALPTDSLFAKVTTLLTKDDVSTLPKWTFPEPGHGVLGTLSTELRETAQNLLTWK